MRNDYQKLSPKWKRKGDSVFPRRMMNSPALNRQMSNSEFHRQASLQTNPNQTAEFSEKITCPCDNPIGLFLYHICRTSASGSILVGPILALLAAFYFYTVHDVCQVIKDFLGNLVFTGLLYIIIWVSTCCSSMSLFSPQFNCPWFSFWVVSGMISFFSFWCVLEIWDPTGACTMKNDMYIRFLWTSSVLLNVPFTLYFLPYGVHYIYRCLTCKSSDYEQVRDHIRYQKAYDHILRSKQRILLSHFEHRPASLIYDFAKSSKVDKDMAWQQRGQYSECGEWFQVYRYKYKRKKGTKKRKYRVSGGPREQLTLRGTPPSSAEGLTLRSTPPSSLEKYDSSRRNVRTTQTRTATRTFSRSFNEGGNQQPGASPAVNYFRQDSSRSLIL